MQDQPIRLLQITDPHLYAGDDGELGGVNTAASLRAVLETVQEDRWPPRAILATGDLVQDHSRAGYERFRDALGGFGIPVHCIPGNHDEPALMRELLDTPPFSYCGVAGYGSWTIPLLSTWLERNPGGRLGPAELERLERALSAHARNHVLVCLHHQPVPMGSPWIDEVGLADAADFLSVIDRHDNVRAVLWGHVHQESERERAGVLMMSTPSTSAQFEPHSKTFTYETARPGWRWLSLHADGTVETEVGRLP
ncbi:MAG: 3',5'-cyclic-AMP phosphodiesterase [Gammaproteobacteria bacterium]